MKRPNILLIFTDQQRADTIAALGNQIIRTPNIDRLVRMGTSFTSAYSPSPVCVPARASMHYGLYPWKTRCFTNGQPMTLPDQVSFMELLTRAGYRTHGIGKCHFQPDPHALRGFQTRESQEEQPQTIESDDYVRWLQDSTFKHVRDPQGTRSEMVYMPQTSQLDEAHHPSQWVGNRAIDFIEHNSNERNPWLLFASFIHPHPPYAPPSPWDLLYRAPDMPSPYLPEGYTERRTRRAENDLYHYHLEGPTNPTLWRLIKARYFSCISFVDYQVGRIMETLERIGQMENTLVIFTSDHGDMLGDLGMVGKAVMNEPSVAIPLIACRPGRFAPDTRIDTPVSLIDIGPTLLRTAGIPCPPEWDGLDLSTIDETGARRTVYSQVTEGANAIFMALNKSWKYVFSAYDYREQLFDRQNDPREDNNLLETGGTGEPDSDAITQAGRLREEIWRQLPPEDLERYRDPESKSWRRWPDEKKTVRRRNIRDNFWADYYIPGYSD